MNLWPWARRRQSAEPEPEWVHYQPQPGPKTPRRCLYGAFAGRPVPCPRCGGKLHQQRHTYLLVTCVGSRPTGVCYVANDMGWFCLKCPTVVIDQERARGALGRAQTEGTAFAVLGFVESDAIPTSQTHLPWSQIESLPMVIFDSSLTLWGLPSANHLE
jgi:hypothetical protein